MALKPDRWEFQTDIDWYCNDVNERGVVLSLSTGGSGAARDDTRNVVAANAASSGAKPIGLLLNDVVTLAARLSPNWAKDEVVAGGKVTLGMKGHWVTNKIVGTPVAGDGAYLYQSGYLTPTNAGSVQTPLVGQFKSAKDEDGYAKVEISLP